MQTSETVRVEAKIMYMAMFYKMSEGMATLRKTIGKMISDGNHRNDKDKISGYLFSDIINFPSAFYSKFNKV